MQFFYAKRSFIAGLICLSALSSKAQTPASYTSSDLFQQIDKLQVLGSVLYIAAHPDDENTRLLAYLSKEKLYRTGYLSLTRGDGGQNLIGDEQGIDLGLIRTQELLAARRMDGAEQFFSRAYDFGFSKSTEEALQIWDKEKILSDVVWVIRQFQPDVIITRFPEDNRAGHGHHSGSAVIAHEAFRAAADANRFPEQLRNGVKPWKAKRIVWNTFNFGGNNTITNEQLRVDVGNYNAILGKGYGEIAAESRSQHKSQGFGVPAGRGVQYEYFLHTEGDSAKMELMDGVETSWKRTEGGEPTLAAIQQIRAAYQLAHPENSVPALVQLYQALNKLPDGYWKTQKMREVQQLIERCSGLWLEATANTELAVQGDSIRVTLQLNSRLGKPIKIKRVQLDVLDTVLNKTLEPNRNLSIVRSFYVFTTRPVTQPYWLERKMSEGSFTVLDQNLIGKPENGAAYQASFEVEIDGASFTIVKPVQYKFTDPVKGELYRPLVVVPPATVSAGPGIVIFHKQEKEKAETKIKVTVNRSFSDYKASITNRLKNNSTTVRDSAFTVAKGMSREYAFTIPTTAVKGLDQDYAQPIVELKNGTTEQPAYLNMKSINYDHIPPIHYFFQDGIRILNMDLKTVGKKIGYIVGAGDKVTIALEQMGYEVVILEEKDLTPFNLQSLDAVITGVRAYNVHEFLPEKHEVLMAYVRNGGNLIVQYNTNNYTGVVRNRIGPYPFSISRNRVTNEKAPVKFVLPDHAVLNYPNKITATDFDNWIQERGLYFAEQVDTAFRSPLAMADPGEQDQYGSLIIADFGKGKFVYTGLAFFRELPAAVPGAYRLLANVIALNKKKVNK